MKLGFEDVVGYEVCDGTRADVVNCVTNWLHEDRRDCRYFACLNPHAAEIASDDRIFHNSLTCADFLTADGIGIVYASRILGGRIRQRITGMDVFLGVMESMDRLGDKSVFFLGSTEETLEKIRSKIKDEFPNVVIAGTYSPPFKPQFDDSDNRKMIEAINDSGADVLWVGLTAPKQEKWIYEHRDSLNVNFAGPIGAAFDFFVGNIDRAGPTVQAMGLEWLPRLLQEPRRLWRRMLISAPKFLLRTIRYRLAKPG